MESSTANSVEMSVVNKKENDVKTQSGLSTEDLNKVEDSSTIKKEDDTLPNNLPTGSSAGTGAELPPAKWENPASFQAYSIRLAGVIGSILLILVILFPSLLTSYYLSCATVYTNEEVYGVVGTKLSNRVVGFLADISNCLLYFGIDVAYMNVLFQQIVDIGREVFNQGDFFDRYRTVAVVGPFDV